MIKEFIGTGKSIEEATLSAKAGLNAPATADIKIEVIQMPEPKRFFGLFGGADAKVKASYDDGRREKSQPKKKKAPAPKKESAKAEKKAPAKAPAKTPAPAPAKETVKAAPEEKITEKDVDLDYACAYLATMIKGLKVDDAKITAKVVDGVVEMDIQCEEYGIIIGRRGETLDALQYLTGLAIKNVINKYVRVSINVGDYRSKREETLRALAVKNANYVLRSGRRFIFEPMNPYERRILHTTVQEIDGVTSRSVGSGMDRKVIIEPEGGEKAPYGKGASRRGGSRRVSKYSAPAPDPDREPKVDRAGIPKFGKIEVNKD